MRSTLELKRHYIYQKMLSIKTSWGEMAYLNSKGSGCPLLFLHGTGCDSSDWNATFEMLPANQHILALDFRGHGKSSVPKQHFTLEDLSEDVVFLLKQLKYREIILVGHSLGGMVAMDIAKKTTVVKGLILLEGWTNLSSAGSAFNSRRFYGTLPTSEIAIIQQKSDKTRDRFNSNIWEIFWSSVKEFDAFTFLETAHIPIFEVFGEMGRNPSTENMLSIPKNPNIRIIWVPNAGHYLPHECPGQVAEICNEFLDNFHRPVLC